MLALTLAVCALAFSAYALFALPEFIRDITGYKLLSLIASSMPLSGYFGISIILLLENTSLPLPGELFLPLAGYYVFVGVMPFLGILAVSSIASFIGSLLIFSISLKVGAPRIYWVATKLGVSQKSLARSEVRLCGRYGSALIVLSSFLPLFGSTIALPAAAVRTRTLRFMFLSIVGALCSTAAYILLGYSLAPIIIEYNSFLTNIVIGYVLYALALVCAAYIGYYALKLLKKRKGEKTFVEKAMSVPSAKKSEV